MRRGQFREESPVERRCTMCGKWWEAGRGHAMTCSPRCRKQRSRQGSDNFSSTTRPATPKPAEASPAPPKASEKKTHPWDAIFTRGKADCKLAMTILGIGLPVTKATAMAAWRKLVMENHPDRGGSTQMLQWVQAAWEYLKMFHQWK